MPGATTNLAFPYPLLTELPDGPDAVQDLAVALDTYLNTLVNGPWVAFTPVWTSTGGGITGVGTGGGMAMRYRKIGRTVHWTFRWAVGTGAAGGNAGNWRWTLPFTAEISALGDIPAIGAGMGLKTDFDRAVTAFATASNPSQMLFRINGSAGEVGPGLPSGWVNGEGIRASGSYEATS